MISNKEVLFRGDLSVSFFGAFQIDLADIKERYKELYGKELADDVKDDTSGEYQKLLLAIINN